MERWTRLDDYRFEEIDSEDETLSSRRNITSDPSYSNLSSRSPIPDEYTMHGSGYPRNSSEEALAYGERYGSSDEEDDDNGVSSQQMVIRSTDDSLALRAQDRIRRAKAKGKPTVNLTHEELEALERRYSKDVPGRRKDSPKGKSSPTRQGVWTRRRSSSRTGLLAAALVPTKQRSSQRSGKKDSPPAEDVYSAGPPYPQSFAAYPGPNGEPMYAPVSYYNAQPSSSRRKGNERPSPPSRSNSGSAPTSSRYPSAASDPAQYRPSRNSSYVSEGSSRHASTSRPSSMYHDNSAPYPPDTQAYAGAYASYSQSSSGGPARRVVSGPADVAYSNVYRRPVPSRVPHSTSDPALAYSRGERVSGHREEYQIPSDEVGLSSADEDSEVDTAYLERRRSIRSGERREQLPSPAAAETARRRRSKR